MIKSWLDANMVWIEIEGEFLADELIGETNRWLTTRKDDYCGYLVDIRKMTRQTAFEQKKAEEAAKKNKSGKPRAIIGKDAATATLVNIYTRFTGAQGLHYFTDVEKAKTWLKTAKG
jgi:hypothetical protein